MVLLLIISRGALAEYCWMVGCQNDIGYIRIYPSPTGQPFPFVGKKLPEVGETTNLCTTAILRRFSMTERFSGEDTDRVSGNMLGSNSTVKILEYVSGSSNDFALIKVINDDNSCPESGCCDRHDLTDTTNHKFKKLNTHAHFLS